MPRVSRACRVYPHAALAAISARDVQKQVRTKGRNGQLPQELHLATFPNAVSWQKALSLAFCCDD